MKFILSVINTAEDEYEVDETFNSMEDLLAYLKSGGYEWTSFVVVVSQINIVVIEKDKQS